MEDNWYVYILRCRGGEYYTGIAKNIKERIKEHNSGKCRYTKYRGPVELVYQEEIREGYGAARKREREMKDYSRERKERLLAR